MKERALVFPEAFFPQRDAASNWHLPTWLVSLSIFILFAINHFAVDMLPGMTAAQRPGTDGPDGTQAQHIWIATKGIAFRISVILLAVPLLGSSHAFLRTLQRRQLLEAVLVSLLVSVALGVLCFPYHDGSGLRSMGTGYGALSSDPFAVQSGYYYRRLLQPGIAYVLGFGGPDLYYIFTLGITHLLVLMTTIALQCWLASGLSATSAAIPAVRSAPTRKYDLWMFLGILSAATASFITFHFQFPGYPEQLGLICLLMLAVVPMPSQTRWAAVALALASHEALILVLAPIIVFCFRPFRERAVALVIVGSYGLLWLAAYRFQLPALVSVHTDLAPAVNTIDIFLSNIPWVILGALAAHKLLWGAFVWAMVSLLRRRQARSALALACLTLVPLATLVVAADASRLAGLGFMGILLAVVILWHNAQHAWERTLLRSLLAVNVIVPSVYISAKHHRIPCPGLYEFMIDGLSRFLGST